MSKRPVALPPGVSFSKLAFPAPCDAAMQQLVKTQHFQGFVVAEMPLNRGHKTSL
jgi:hypothetical protein